MSLLTDILAFPFMQRALVAGFLIGLLLASLGVLATLRKMAFFGEGVAHASLAGIAIAIFAGFAPMPFAVAWAIMIAVAIYFLERKTKLPSDTVIGILFTASMAFGVIIMSLTQGYQPELLSFLFGSILTIQNIDLIMIAVSSIIILTWLGISLPALTFLSLSEEAAQVAGINTKLQTLLFYIALAVATVLGVKILGIVLVSALIVLPSATSRMLTNSFKSYFIVSIIVAEITILLGLLLSFVYDLPSGAVIVLVGTLLFVIAAILNSLQKEN